MPAWSADPADGRLWCRTTLDDMAGLIDGYELWKDGPWYHDVDWQRVSTAVDEVLQRVCRNGAVAMSDLLDPLRRVRRTLRQPDTEGLDSLVSWPIEVTRNQLHNGGHRLAAMRSQGVQFAPSGCMRADVGAGIDARAVYPIQEAASRGGLSRSEKPE